MVGVTALPSWPDRGPTPWRPSPPRTRVPSHQRGRRRPLWPGSLVVGRRARGPAGRGAGLAPAPGRLASPRAAVAAASFSPVGPEATRAPLCRRPELVGDPGGTSGRGQGGGGIGGLLNSSTPGTAITEALKSGASGYRWVAAVVGSNEASGYQLAAGEPIMAIGGFNGTDPAPTLAEFENYVKEKQIHYFIASGSGFGGPIRRRH